MVEVGTHICLIQSQGIVAAITDHGNRKPNITKVLHESTLVPWQETRKDGGSNQQLRTRTQQKYNELR